jgi:hypothetical protein
MSGEPSTDWRREFGIADADATLFFTTKAEVTAAERTASQAHILRRAFDVLDLDGIYCSANGPLVYFKRVSRIDVSDVADLHRRFWNHGGAPVLVLISPREVHVYSGLVQPAPHVGAAKRIEAFVESLDRTTSALRDFLPAVESGEYFRRNERSFNPANRVDRDLLSSLEATRQELSAVTGALEPRELDALLCRLVFACYLFDRRIVGKSYLEAIDVQHADHLRDILGMKPRSTAKQALYALFRQLGADFNGDLFSTDLTAESKLVSAAYIETLDDFFHGTHVGRHQRSFWPYDFSLIPIEVVSAIYERFLQSSERSEGAFYTPRFLAEIVLDLALSPLASLLGRRYLDPSCGSGIFLVGLFNRLAEEWKRANPGVRNNRRAQELRKILCSSLYGIDINPTACRITAFSLYLAYLDQLSPRDIQELQEHGHRLPRLVHDRSDPTMTNVEGNIWCGDFFDETLPYPTDVDLVIGNPPWGSTATEETAAGRWAASPDHFCPVSDKQISAVFMWKAALHASGAGRICLVLPHGTLFKHSDKAIEFQRAFFQHHAVDHILNLTDYQFFLFADAQHPAIVITYQPHPPESAAHRIEYWTPKTDWLVTRAEVITVMPEDRDTVTTAEVLADLDSEDAPQIWKQRSWATPRDRRLLDRLSSYPRLRDHVRQIRDAASSKPWLIAEGFQPVGKGDDPKKAVKLALPSDLFIDASSRRLDLFLLPRDCTRLPAPEKLVRSRSNKNTDIFRAPHVLVTQGFVGAAFADFAVSFQHAVRGITGPKEDRELLAFLAAYLRSTLASYYLFHTSANWGVSRRKVHVEELLRLPFPLPDALQSSSRAWEIVREASRIVTTAAKKADADFVDRDGIVTNARASTDALMNEYFDLVPNETRLVADTLQIIAPSFRPGKKRRAIVPTMAGSRDADRHEYIQLLCATLNGWSHNSRSRVEGVALASPSLGIAIAVLQKMAPAAPPFKIPDNIDLILAALHRFRSAASHRINTFDLYRGAKVFDGDRLYIVKPIGRRFWTNTAALNDADEIAGTILMHIPQRTA